MQPIQRTSYPGISPESAAGVAGGSCWFPDGRDWHCQPVGLGLQRRAARIACSWLRRSGGSTDLGSKLKGLASDGLILGSRHFVAAEQEKVVDPVIGGQETLCLAGRLEPLRLPLSSSRGLVRRLRPVIQPLVLPVLDRGHHLTLDRPVARQLVGHHDTRRPALPLQQLAHQALGGLRVAATLHGNVQHHPGLVDRAPQPILYAGDRQHDFIHVPPVPSRGQPTADLACERLPELQRLLAESFIVDDDAACSQQLVHDVQAQRKAEVEPNGVTDDLSREPVAGKAEDSGRCHPARLPCSAASRKPASPKVDGAHRQTRQHPPNPLIRTPAILLGSMPHFAFKHSNPGSERTMLVEATTEVAFVFGPYRFIPGQKLLLREHRPVKLGGRAIDILHLLLMHAGKEVSANALIEFAWPHIFVDKCNLKVHISSLRRVLVDTLPQSTYIATVVGRGYQFVGRVRAERAGPDDLSCKNLPVVCSLPAPSALVGRQREIEGLGRTLHVAQLVTLVSPGGVGKTGLAMVVAHARHNDFPDGIHFVDLSVINDPVLVTHLIATAISVRGDPADVLSPVVKRLQNRRMLIVLDNCQHVLRAAATVAARLTEAGMLAVVRIRA